MIPGQPCAPRSRTGVQVLDHAHKGDLVVEGGLVLNQVDAARVVLRAAGARLATFCVSGLALNRCPTFFGQWPNLPQRLRRVRRFNSSISTLKLLRAAVAAPKRRLCCSLEISRLRSFHETATLRLDPGGAFRSQRIVDFCDQEGIQLDNTPADAHWQIGVCEQAIQGAKEVMTKLCVNDPEVSPETALAVAILTFNHRDSVRGFSPIQHVFGHSPDSTGRFLNGVERLPEEFVVESASVNLEQTAKRRAEAEKAHAEWVASQRISRALNSRPRPHLISDLGISFTFGGLRKQATAEEVQVPSREDS